MKKNEKNNLPNTVKILFAIVIVIAAIFGKVVINDDGSVEFVTDNSAQTVVSDSLVDVEELEGDLTIHFIDQTTTNMIQGLKGIFARKPLISRGI